MKIISMNKNRKEIRKDIISDLREPHDIGIEVKAKAISYAKVTPNLRNIIRAIMASLSLGVLSFSSSSYCNIYSIIDCSVYILCF